MAVKLSGALPEADDFSHQSRTPESHKTYFRVELVGATTYEECTEAGCNAMQQRADKQWDRTQRDCEMLDIDPAVDEALLVFIAKPRYA